MFIKNTSRACLLTYQIFRLAVTIRFLATGDNYESLEKMFRISRAVILEFIPVTCQAIIDVLKPFIKVSINVKNVQCSNFSFNFPFLRRFQNLLQNGEELQRFSKTNGIFSTVSARLMDGTAPSLA